MLYGTLCDGARLSHGKVWLRQNQSRQRSHMEGVAREGVWGAKPPNFKTVGPSHEVTLNLSGDNTHSQLERSSFLLPLVPAAFPATWVTLEVFRPSRRPIPPPSPPTRVFAGVVYFRLREEWGWPTAVSMPTDTYCTCVVCVGRVHVLAVVCMCVTASGPRRPRACCALCECFGPT